MKSQTRTGFTLAEVIVAIGLAALLLYGVTVVFRTTSRSIGAGMAISTFTRDIRSTQQFIHDDMKTNTGDAAPFMVLHSERRFAFFNAADLVSAVDKAKPNLVDIDGDNLATSAGEDLSTTPAIGHYRNCRTDTVGFFTQQLHRKQTGTGTQLVSPMGALDGYVWYGHPRLQAERGSSTYFDQGEGTPSTNPVSFYSSDWILGRRSLLLTTQQTDLAGVNQVRISNLAGGGNLLLGKGAYASGEPDARLRLIESSRHDLINTTAERMRQQLLALERTSPGTDWQSSVVYRFEATAVPMSPITPEIAAQVAPLMLLHCRQFIVEYAGDFVTQKRDVVGLVAGTPPDGRVTYQDINHVEFGEVTAAEPDGIIDFYAVPTGANSRDGTPERIERTRFYGFPRDLEPYGTIVGWQSGRRNNAMTDVVPLRDIVRSGSNSTPALASYSGAAWERALPAVAGEYLANNALRSSDTYTCVWGPGDAKPRMLRFVIVLEDPDRKLTGQSYEFVLQLGY